MKTQAEWRGEKWGTARSVRCGVEGSGVFRGAECALGQSRQSPIFRGLRCLGLFAGYFFQVAAEAEAHCG